MKTKRMLFAALVVVVLTAGPALAAVNGSHHDLSAYQGATEVCLYCHGVLDTTAATGNYGNVGELCLSRCHNGSGNVTTQDVVPQRAATLDEAGTVVGPTYTVDAVNVTNGFAHGLNPADLLVPTTGAQVTFDAIGQALPYGTAGQIECTSCHNVHSNANTPFLQRDLFTGGPGGNRSFCEACHTARGNNWAGGEAAPNGEHPVNFALILNANVGSKYGNRTNAERYGRYINLDGNIFDVATPNGAALNDPATHYVPGGKVSGFANAAGGETFGCYTCHGVHVDANGTTAQVNLILRDAVSADGQWNPICVGCHGQDTTGANDPNPGTTPYYHPVGSTANAATGNTGNVYTYTASTGNFSFQVDLSAILGAAGSGQNGIADTVVGIDTTNGARPRCGSCHDVHGGINNSMALVDLDGTRDGSFTGKICDACHTGVGLPDVADNPGQTGEPADSHHRTTTADWSGATFTDEGDGDTLNLDGTNAASWLTAADHSNGLGCADCHVFTSDGAGGNPAGSTHSTAHNW